MRKRNILFVLNDTQGGATLSARDVIRALRSTGRYRVFVVVSDTRTDAKREQWDHILQEVDGGKRLFLPWWSLEYRLSATRCTLRYINTLRSTRFHWIPIHNIVHLIEKWKIDIVHTNTSLNIQGAIAARITGKPHLWHIREVIGPDRLFRFPPPFSLIKKIFYGLSTRVVFNSKESASALDGPSHKKAIVLPNAIPLESFVDPDARKRGLAFRRKLGLNDDNIMVGMIANLTSPKHQDLFIQAAETLAAQNSNTRFVIIGAIPEPTTAHAQEILNLVAKSQVRDQIILAGFQEDVPAVVHAMDIMLHTSIDESFGRVIIEAMAAGKPVVCFRSGGPQHIVQHGITGYMAETGKVEQLVSFTEELIQSAPKRKEMGQAGFRLAQQEYSMTTFMEKLETLYNDVIEG